MNKLKPLIIFLISADVIASEIVPIQDCFDLQDVNKNLNGTFTVQAEMIDCSQVDFNPIGNEGNEFTGSFDGNNVSIHGLKIESSKNVGLFGAISGNANIQNVNLIDAVVKGNENVGLLVGIRTETEPTGTSLLLNNKVSGKLAGITNVGGLIGEINYNQNFEGAILKNNTADDIKIMMVGNVWMSHIGGLVGNASLSDIENCHVSGTIKVPHYGNNVAGLVGSYIPGKHYIDDSSATITIDAPLADYIGGLIGTLYGFNQYHETGGIKNSHAISKLKGHRYIGGLLGFSNILDGNKLFLENSYANTEIEGLLYLGGLGGYLIDINVFNSFAKGNIQSDGHMVGGLLGVADSLLIKNAYSQVTVNATDYVGGLIGKSIETEIYYTYATGKVASKTSENVGGLIGSKPSGKVIDSYWNTETTSQSHSDGGTPANTDELQQEVFYKNWNFQNIWYIESNHYPKFQYEIINQ